MAKKKKAPDLEATDCSPGESIQETTEGAPASPQSRREFLLKAGVGLAAVTVAAVLPSQVLGASLSEQEIKAIAGKITGNRGAEVAPMGDCGPEYCDKLYCTGNYCELDKNYCQQTVCPENFCPPTPEYSGSCQGGDHCQNRFCENEFCASNHNCLVGHDDCEDQHCENDYCGISYCDTGNSCTSDNCEGKYCSHDYCKTENESCGSGAHCETTYCA